MMDLAPGWVDRFTTMAQQALTEEDKSKLTGLTPRRCWRGNIDASKQSRMRGSAPGRPKRDLERVLGPVDPED